MTEFDIDILDSGKLVEAIKPIMAGQNPAIQGAVLGDLMAMWLAGHPDFIREAMLELQMSHIRRLMPIMEARLFGGHGHPQNQGKPS